jgi:hypothetical protein
MLKRMNKGSISYLLIEQVKKCLYLAIEERKSNNINKEIQLGINIHLLLGITLEGIINEIGEKLLDRWTWKELEKGSTPFKWRIISGLRKGFDPSKEPMQTIIKLRKIRNKIAHPKLENLSSDVIIISEKGEIKRNVKDEDKLPNGNLTVYLGFEKLIKDYSARVSLTNMKKVLKAINEIKKLHKIKREFEWSDTIFKEIDKIEISKNEFDK